MELDHVVELHSVCYVFDASLRQREGPNFNARNAALKESLKDVVNDTKNLNFTSGNINTSTKFHAVDDFTKDFRNESGLYKEAGLLPCLKNANSQKDPDFKLDRSITKKIQRCELKASFDFFIDEVQEMDDALHGKMAESLHDLFTVMRLVERKRDTMLNRKR
jgi:hypothetical protein